MNKTSKFLLSVTLAGAAFATSSSAFPLYSVSAAASTTSASPSTSTSATPTKSSHNPYEVAGIDDPAAFHQFFFTFQQAVKNNDKKAVSSMINYPLNVYSNGKTYKITNAARFIAKYDSIMTPEVKRTLAYAIEDDLFVNWKGVMVGSGELWFGQFNDKIALFAVNK
ncbi:hypothetical protein [Paenibacillus sp. WLX2291]|uniref:hypothetical protein n=1 Tax=Paenibacillus sp. WLX2291 TaxID=3296934 RepID=UPI003983EB30